MHEKNDPVNGINRACFLCGSDDGMPLFSENWEVTGLGKVKVGIRVCPKCGMVLQDPLVPKDTMSKWYLETGSYANPSRMGSPPASKIDAVSRQLLYLKRKVNKPGRAFQVGCSDGYTLSQFKNLGWEVEGIDPSATSAEIAKKIYNIHYHVGFFEDYLPRVDERYNLIILTHILEHLFDPLPLIVKCREMLAPDGCLLVEVPVLLNPQSWGITFFSFEHVNYFSLHSLQNLLNSAGFDFLISPEVSFEQKDYPVITCLASIGGMRHQEKLLSDTTDALACCNEFLSRQKKMWSTIDRKLANELKSVSSAVIWGAGIHTTQLLLHTSLQTSELIKGIVDVDSNKWGKFLGNHKISDPKNINYGDPTLAIIISSAAFEKEIHNNLKSINGIQAKIITLYEE